MGAEAFVILGGFIKKKKKKIKVGVLTIPAKSYLAIFWKFLSESQ